MSKKSEYEVLLDRVTECELLSELASDASIRKKCAELAVEYRVLLERVTQVERPVER
jgi:hypothetical protein